MKLSRIPEALSQLKQSWQNERKGRRDCRERHKKLGNSEPSFFIKFIGDLLTIVKNEIFSKIIGKKYPHGKIRREIQEARNKVAIIIPGFYMSCRGMNRLEGELYNKGYEIWTPDKQLTFSPRSCVEVRRQVAQKIREVIENNERERAKLAVLGYSMGGNLLHEMAKNNHLPDLPDDTKLVSFGAATKGRGIPSTALTYLVNGREVKDPHPPTDADVTYFNPEKTTTPYGFVNGDATYDVENQERKKKSSIIRIPQATSHFAINDPRVVKAMIYCLDDENTENGEMEERLKKQT